MPQLILRGTLFLLFASCLLATGPEQTTAPSARSSSDVLSDTLRYTVAPGEPLLLTLPDTLDGQPVRTYTALRVPALSWLVGHAFFWHTRPQETGRYRLRFSATPSDTLTLVVTIEAPER